MLTTLNKLRFKENNLNIKSYNCNNKEKTSLKKFRF